MRRDLSCRESNPETADSFVEVFWIITGFIKRFHRKLVRYLVKKSWNQMQYGLKMVVGEWFMENNSSLMVAHVVATWTIITYRIYRRMYCSSSSTRDSPGVDGYQRTKRNVVVNDSETENMTAQSSSNMSFLSDDHANYSPNLHSEDTEKEYRDDASGTTLSSRLKHDTSKTTQPTVSSVKTMEPAIRKGNSPAEGVSSENIMSKLNEDESRELNIEEMVELNKHSEHDYRWGTSQWADDKESYWHNFTDGSSAIRETVYAEVYDPAEEELWTPPVHPKTDDQRVRLVMTVKDILLFRELDSAEMREVIDAMALKEVNAGETIIQEGDNGDFFYVIDSGTFEAYVTKNGITKLVKTYSDSGNFGELSLLYDVPRAATVKAATDGKLWALDRQTFRTVVLQAAYKKREMYDSLIANVPILKELEPYERMSLADALVPKTFAKGSKIISQGDEANGMYFIVDGYVRITVKNELDNDVELKVLGPGQYFGELALLTQKPRAASAYAAGFVKLAFLDKGGFERLLGPCLQIMERNISSYEKETHKAHSK